MLEEEKSAALESLVKLKKAKEDRLREQKRLQMLRKYGDYKSV